MRVILIVTLSIISAVPPLLAITKEDGFRQLFDRHLKMVEEMERRMDLSFKSRLNSKEDDTEFFEGFSPLAFQDHTIGKWSESEKERVYTISSGAKESPMDIKVKDGFIEIRGTVEEMREKKDEKGIVIESSKSVRKIYQNIAIPKDVDANNPQMETVNGEVIIRFKKR